MLPVRPFKWYTLNVYHVKGSCILVEKRKNTRFIGFNFNIAFKIHFSGIRHPCKKMKPTLDHSGGGGVHGKACWLIAS